MVAQTSAATLSQPLEGGNCAIVAALEFIKILYAIHFRSEFTTACPIWLVLTRVVPAL